MISGVNSNPFGNLSSGLSGGGGLSSGIGGLGSQVGDSSGGDQAGGVAGITPNQQASPADGASFGSTLRDMIISNPSKAMNHADALGAREVAFHDVDPQDLALATAKAGIEVQMSTRTISQAVQGIRTLFQMQI